MECAQDRIRVSVTRDGGEKTVVLTARRTPGVRIARNNVTVAVMDSVIPTQGTASAQQVTQESVVRLNARKDPMDLTVSCCVSARTAPHVV